jgi:hypothetical protein
VVIATAGLIFFSIYGPAPMFAGAEVTALRIAGDGNVSDIQVLDWSDLIPAQDSASATRLRDGSLPRGLVQHGQLGPSGNVVGGESSNDADMANQEPPKLVRTLGGYSSLNAPPRRLSDAVGGLGSLRALQPRGGANRLELDGKDVRIAGFVAPLRFDGGKISEFLLVPYVGACIHVPPPPSNQIVIVSGFEGFRPSGDLLYPVQVTGKLHVAVVKTDLGDVAYQIKGAKVERY